MKKALVILILLSLLYSCEKSEAVSHSLSGNYVGIFSRSGMDTSQVTLFFDQNRFEGKSNRQHYPAVCRGSFELDDNHILFTDSCSWTANFDWSLILSGMYNINFSDGTVRIWKINGAVTDEYLLRQPFR
ncbi:MAG TPA: hypothetical protein VFO70_06960 [Chitinophagaceae bacterium]|nr:hypothetical protein [Chitinophagaceae bacterium]